MERDVVFSDELHIVGSRDRASSLSQASGVPWSWAHSLVAEI